jgi:membrane protease subunit HflK
MTAAAEQSDLKRVFRTAKLVGVGLAVLLVLLYMASGFYSVKPEQRGVVRRFGRVISDNILPGIHYHLPWPIETVLRPATTEVRSMTVNFGLMPGSQEVSEAKEAEALLTGDENVVLASLLIQYMIDRPSGYLFQIRNGPDWLLSRIVKAACVKNVAEMTVDEVLTTGRFLFQNNVKQEVQTSANEYDLGVRIASIQIQTLQPPTKVAGAFRDVSSAREDKHKLVREAEGNRNREIPSARSKADRTISEAGAYANEMVKRAEGDANRFTATWDEYRKAKNVTAHRLYLEAMEKILPKTKKMISNPQAEQMLMGGSNNTRNNQTQLPVLPKDLWGTPYDRDTPFSQR